MSKLLIIGGPTATGKTKLGITLAKKFNGEIVSADSRQVYRGMTIGTGKDIKNSKFEIRNSKQIQNSNFQIGYYEVDGIKVWLLDVVDPDYRFNVADYKECADSVIEDIFKRGKMPVVVGGTGFYIKAITEGIETIGVEPDWELRKILSAKDTKILSAELKKLDTCRWERMNVSDRKNPRRLIRAIEIAQKLKTQNSNVKTKTQNLKLDMLYIGLKASNEILYQRIDQRVEERVKEEIEEEIRGLLAKGYNWENSALGTTLAYREWQGYFEGKMPKEEVIKRWKFDEHEYSRRQMTWFRRDSRINWFDITQEDWQAKVEKLVESWYSNT